MRWPRWFWSRIREWKPHFRRALRRQARVARTDGEFLCALAAHSEQAQLLYDLPSRRFLYAGPVFEQLTGIAPDTLSGPVERWAGLIHAEDRPRLAAALQALSSDRIIESEFRIHRANGTIRWLRARAVPLRDPAGVVDRRAVFVEDVSARRHTEEQLLAARVSLEENIRERTAQLQALLDDLRAGAARLNEAQRIARLGGWELDLVTNRLQWSEEIYRIFEIDPYGFGASYEAFLDAVHPEDRDVVNRAYTDSVNNRTPYEIVHRLRMPDGRIKHVRERCETFYGADGRPLRSAGTVQDITAQLQAQQERDRAQALLRTIMDSSPDWIYVKDREHRFLVVNRSCAAAAGHSPEELIGRPDTDFWPRDLCEGDPERGIRGFHEDDRLAFAGQLVHNPEVPALRREDGARLFDTYKCPLRDVSGEIYGVLGYSRDVTERRRAERDLRDFTATLEQRVAARTAELAAERNFTETLLNIVGALVVVLDRDGRIVRFNRSCEAVTGYATAEALGRCVWDFLLLPEEREPIQGVFRTLRAAHFPVHYENAWLTKDGRRRVIAWSNSVITDADGEVEYVVGTGVDITERKATEQALRASEEMFRQLAENIQETFFMRDLASGQMVYVSPSYEKIWGRPISALYDDPADFLKSVHPEDRPMVQADRDRQYTGDSYFNREYRVLRSDGSVRWVWARTFPIRNADGQVYRIAGLVQDLTERKTVEIALRASEQILRQMADNIDEVLFVRDLVPDRVVYVSPAYDSIFGRPRAALRENAYDFLDAVHPEDRPAVQQAMARQRAGQGWFNLEYRLQRPDGEIRWVWAQTFPIRGAHGRVDRVAGVLRDLTERKRAEQELAASEAQFRLLAENVREVFWMTSPDRRTLYYISPAWETVWGRSCAELYANPRLFLEAIHPEDRPRVAAQVEPQLSGEFVDQYDHEFRIIRSDGEVRWIRSRYRPVRDLNNQVFRVAGVSEDVTERKRSEEARLRQAQEQRDTLVREVHHRIKNNLQGVVGLLRQHAGEHPQTALPLEMAIARIQSMALVYGLRSSASTERVMLCHVIEAICRSVTDLTGAAIAPPRVERHASFPIPVTENEAVPVALILNELVFNAVKHHGQVAGRPRVSIDIHYRDQDGATVTIVTPGARLPHGFDFAAGRGLGSGLQLVRSLLPRPAADLMLRDSDTGVIAELTLRPPVIMALGDALRLQADDSCVTGIAN